MSLYLNVIRTAVGLFPILAALFTVPYIIHLYRRFGSVLILRVVVVYSFIFYLLCAYFLTILPLPPVEEVAQYTSPTMQLIPFYSLKDLFQNPGFQWRHPSTYLSLVKSADFLQLLFNVFLTVPFGVYLRYYFRCRWKKTLLLTFLLTLSFECIQLSALFGMYPRPYRLFDVDDLITNTLGGLFGYAVTPLFVHFLPTRERLDTVSYHRGHKVSALRRIFAFFVDLFCLTLLAVLLDLVLPLPFYGIYFCTVALYFLLLPILWKGRTFGKWLLKLQLQQRSGATPRWYQYTLYYSVFYLLLPAIPFIGLLLAVPLIAGSLVDRLFLLLLGFALLLFYLICNIQMIVSLFVKDYFPWFRAKLVHVSTVKGQETAEEPFSHEPGPQGNGAE